jgi:hypothetical protein
MGNPRPKPKRLAEKLRAIRLNFGLSQTDMLRRLGLDDTMHYSRISEYEQGAREPSLVTLLKPTSPEFTWRILLTMRLTCQKSYRARHVPSDPPRFGLSFRFRQMLFPKRSPFQLHFPTPEFALVLIKSRKRSRYGFGLNRNQRAG